MASKCRTRDTTDTVNLLESDLVACLTATDGIQGGTCPNGFTKIEGDELCPEITIEGGKRKRVCCLITPTVDLKVT